MSDKDNGGPAFPFPVLHGRNAPEGLSIRDYFAAKAMQGAISAGVMKHSEIPEYAYLMADAMIQARKQ